MINTERASENGSSHTSSPTGGAELPGTLSALTADVAMARQNAIVIEMVDRMERLYREQLGSRDRELVMKDRLLAEIERRAEKAEGHLSVLEDYIANLPPENGQRSGDPVVAGASGDQPHGRWRFWR
ncbi:MAG: hypothetical protein ACR2JC_12140 [Chloroflexota bacterium]